MCTTITNTNINNEEIHKMYFEFLSEFTQNTKTKDLSESEVVFVPRPHPDGKTPFDIFLECIPEDIRQVYNCNTCKRFLNKFSTLFYVKDDGSPDPIFYNLDIDDYHDEDVNPFHKFYNIMCLRMVNVTADRPFYDTTETILNGDRGDDYEHGFIHFKGINPVLTLPYTKNYMTNNEFYLRMKTFMSSIMNDSKFPLENMKTLYITLQARPGNARTTMLDSLSAMIAFKESIKNIKNSNFRRNIAAKYVVNNGEGFWNFASTAIGSTLERVGTMPMDKVLSFFDTITAPDKYMRPQTKNVVITNNMADNAFKTLQSVGLTGDDLKRRICYLDEIIDHAIWTPPKKEPVEEDANPFAKLANQDKSSSKDYKKIDGGNISMDTIINIIKTQNVTAIDLYRSLYNRADFPVYAFTGPAVSTPGKLFYYDTDDFRIPYAWFTSSSSSQFDDDPIILSAIRGVTSVKAVVPLPNTWNEEIYNKTGIEGYIFVTGANKTITVPNSAIFPELLRKDLFDIRRVIAAYSDSTPMTGEYNEDRVLAIGRGLIGQDFSFINRNNKIVLTLDDDVQVTYNVTSKD